MTTDDTERDAWLREALRHAPDAGAAPPAALSEAILRKARAAAKAAREQAPQRRPGAWAAAWRWLARPPVAAGFASVMVATLLGLMWWDQPIDPTITRPPAPRATPMPAPAPAAVPAPTPMPETGTAAKSAPSAEPETPAGRKRVAPGPSQQSGARRGEAAPAPSDDSRADAAPPPPSANESAAAPDEPRAFASGQSARRAAAPALQSRGEPDATRPVAFAEMLASIAAQPERWRWQRGDAMRPITPALQRWLARIDAAAAPHWRNRADAAPAGEAVVLRLYRDGELAATLRLDDDSFTLTPGPQAGLPRATTAALKQALDDATR